MESLRKPTSNERNLIDFLIRKSKIHFINWKTKLQVCQMNDGGMGGLSLFTDGIFVQDRLLGKQISECQFKDADGVVVLASLYVDNKGKLFELDIWKTNFEPLIRIPRSFKNIDPS